MATRFKNNPVRTDRDNSLSPIDVNNLSVYTCALYIHVTLDPAVLIFRIDNGDTPALQK